MTKITIEPFTPDENCPICWRPMKAETITKEEYDRLMKDSSDLAKLHAGGVDNWEWYDESLYGDEEEEEDDEEEEEDDE